MCGFVGSEFVSQWFVRVVCVGFFRGGWSGGFCLHGVWTPKAALCRDVAPACRKGGLALHGAGHCGHRSVCEDC